MIKAKTLIKKSTGEYIQLMGDKNLSISPLPTLFSSTATMERIDKIYPDFDWKDAELIDIVILKSEEYENIAHSPEY